MVHMIIDNTKFFIFKLFPPNFLSVIHSANDSDSDNSFSTLEYYLIFYSLCCHSLSLGLINFNIQQFQRILAIMNIK